MKNLFLLLALFFIYISTSKAAQYYTFKDPSCKAYIDSKKIKQYEIVSVFSDQLKEKKIFAESFPGNKKIVKGDLYFELLKESEGIIWKDCIITLALKRSEGNFPSAEDKVLYETKNKRQFPRITFGGKERCERALKDAFVHIPTCVKR